MKYRGFAGAIVDGSVRDTPQIRRLQFPVFSRGVVPSTTINHFRVTGKNVPVMCAGVPVRKDDIIVADISILNPNVFYELGLAHAVAKPAILVAESIDDIPFDLRALRVIIYNKNEHDWGVLLQAKIETAIKEVLASPLDSVLPTFLEVKEVTSPKTVTEAEGVLISLKQDIDSIKLALQLNEASASGSFRYPLSRTEAMKLAREYRERGTNDEYVISTLHQKGWSVQAARNLIALMDQIYVRERVKARRGSNSGQKKSDRDGR